MGSLNTGLATNGHDGVIRYPSFGDKVHTIDPSTPPPVHEPD